MPMKIFLWLSECSAAPAVWRRIHKVKTRWHIISMHLQILHVHV